MSTIKFEPYLYIAGLWIWFLFNALFHFNLKLFHTFGSTWMLLTPSCKAYRTRQKIFRGEIFQINIMWIVWGLLYCGLKIKCLLWLVENLPATFYSRKSTGAASNVPSIQHLSSLFGYRTYMRDMPKSMNTVNDSFYSYNGGISSDTHYYSTDQSLK